MHGVSLRLFFWKHIWNESWLSDDGNIVQSQILWILFLRWEYLKLKKMVTYRVWYVFDTDTFSIRLDTRIGKVSVKSLFLNKKIISDTISIRLDTHIGKISIKSLCLNKKVIPDTRCLFVSLTLLVIFLCQYNFLFFKRKTMASYYITSC
jgi:hypothetical protein